MTTVLMSGRKELTLMNAKHHPSTQFPEVTSPQWLGDRQRTDEQRDGQTDGQHSLARIE